MFLIFSWACFIAIEAIKKIARSRAATSKHACEIVVVFTVQEEVGLRGATTSANAVGADIGIGLDTTLAVDTPGVPDNQRVTRHGDGVGIMIQDSSMIADHKLVSDLCAVAKKKKIAHQRCILPRGGQDGAAAQGGATAHRGEAGQGFSRCQAWRPAPLMWRSRLSKSSLYRFGAFSRGTAFSSAGSSAIWNIW